MTPSRRHEGPPAWRPSFRPPRRPVSQVGGSRPPGRRPLSAPGPLSGAGSVSGRRELGGLRPSSGLTRVAPVCPARRRWLREPGPSHPGFSPRPGLALGGSVRPVPLAGPCAAAFFRATGLRLVPLHAAGAAFIGVLSPCPSLLSLFVRLAGSCPLPLFPTTVCVAPYWRPRCSLVGPVVLLLVLVPLVRASVLLPLRLALCADWGLRTL